MSLLLATLASAQDNTAQRDVKVDFGFRDSVSMWMTERHVPTMFVDRVPVMSSFVTKFPGAGSAVPMHREPTFVDPEVGEGYNVWIPLEDVGAAAGNGALDLLPGTED
ncbi:MAG: phytanoyl-CoA dioxygenase family protein, partial [bacterium]